MSFQKHRILYFWRDGNYVKRLIKILDIKPILLTHRFRQSAAVPTSLNHPQTILPAKDAKVIFWTIPIRSYFLESSDICWGNFGVRLQAHIIAYFRDCVSVSFKWTIVVTIHAKYYFLSFIFRSSPVFWHQKAPYQHHHSGNDTLVLYICPYSFVRKQIKCKTCDSYSPFISMIILAQGLNSSWKRVEW